MRNAIDCTTAAADRPDVTMRFRSTAGAHLASASYRMIHFDGAGADEQQRQPLVADYVVCTRKSAPVPFVPLQEGSCSWCGNDVITPQQMGRPVCTPCFSQWLEANPQ